MLGNLGWGEVLVLAVLGLLIFGPDKLPGVISDASKMVRQLRTMARSAATDLKAELGPEMADLDLRSLNPRRFVEDFLGDEPAPTPVGGPIEMVPLAEGERPPYDPDAT